MDLFSKIELLSRITKPQIAALKKLGIFTIRDLLFHLPYRYLDFSKLTTIRDMKAGEPMSLQVTIKEISSRFSFRTHINLAEAVVSDGSGSIKVVWFNQGYLAKTLHKGEELFLSGTPEYYNFGLQLTNPLWEKVSDFPVHTARLVPVYHLTADLYPKTLHNLIKQALPIANNLEESLPEPVLKNRKLMGISQTVKLSHFPENLEQVEQARKRLAFEEIFINQLLAQKHKLELAQKQSFAIKFEENLMKNFVSSLPFELTAGQKKAVWEILQDLEKPTPMNRLLEADVGSGKTVVALMAALQVTQKDWQVAFLAPTEILARQHFETAKKILSSVAKLNVILLTNNFHEINNQEEAKTKLQKSITEGMPGIFIGTHALLAEKVKFKNLALVIIDEQHRFGVEQRSELLSSDGKVPHLLSLTATPIPRTLQLAYFGELSISQIKSKPANRKPIATKLVAKTDRPKAYQFIRDQIQSGRQIFVITPLIEESENLEVKAAKTEFANLQKIFPQFKVGLLYGKMKGAVKETVMADFLANQIQILVSTSVVEVGVDVPNASVMLIESAERFGLAQLHQFRGRVGRAEHQSYCFLFTENENPEVVQRLQGFTKTQDGFALAELDLKQRGFGELYGAKQSGWNFKHFNPSYTSLIQPAREEVLNLLQDDINLLKYPLLQEQIKNQVIHFE